MIYDDHSVLHQAALMIPRFWDLADQCSNTRDIWCLNHSGRTTLQMDVILGGRFIGDF